MTITPKTKLSELVKAYPWMPAYAKTLDSRLAALETPFGRMMMRRTTLEQAANLAGLPLEDLMDKIQEAIRAHE